MEIAGVGTDTRIVNGGSYTPPVGTTLVVVKVLASVDAPNDSGLGGVAVITNSTGAGVSELASIYDTSANPDGYSAIGVFVASQFTAGASMTISASLGGTITATNEISLVICARSGVDQTTPVLASGGIVEAEAGSGSTFQPAALTTVAGGWVDYAIARTAVSTTMSADSGVTVDDNNSTLTDIRATALSAATSGVSIQPTFSGGGNGSWAVSGISLNPSSVVVTNPVISSLSSTLFQTGDSVTLVGTELGTATGSISVSSENSLSGSVVVSMAVTAWSDTTAQFTVARGAHTNRIDKFVFVERDDGGANTAGATVSYLPVVTITDDFRDVSGTAQDSLSNLSVLVYHDVPTYATADQVLSAQTLGANSTANWSLSAGALDDGDVVYVSAWDSAGAAIATAFQTTPTYT